jgi:phage tail tube protein FII
MEPVRLFGLAKLVLLPSLDLSVSMEWYRGRGNRGQEEIPIGSREALRGKSKSQCILLHKSSLSLSNVLS